MSERRRLRGELIDAWMRADDVVRPLRDALEYGDRYTFLWEDNPGLREAIAERLSEAEKLAVNLDALQEKML